MRTKGKRKTRRGHSYPPTENPRKRSSYASPTARLVGRRDIQENCRSRTLASLSKKRKNELSVHLIYS